jgi:NADH-quinone oxidoreductase subunit E
VRELRVFWGLHLLQEHCGCVGPEQVAWTAAKLGMRRIEIEGLVSFYPMFTPQPRGRFHLKVCRTLACELCGCRAIAAHLRQRLGIADGETTADGRFTLSAVECLAACGAGPVMMVNDETHGRLTPGSVRRLLRGIRRSKPAPRTAEVSVAG